MTSVEDLPTPAVLVDLDVLAQNVERMQRLAREAGVALRPHAKTHKSPEVGNLIFRRRALAGSLIGGIRETQEMLDFCHEHGLTADIEMIRMDEINTAYDRMVRSDVKYRFVMDMATLG